MGTGLYRDDTRRRLKAAQEAAQRARNAAALALPPATAFARDPQALGPDFGQQGRGMSYQPPNLMDANIPPGSSFGVGARPPDGAGGFIGASSEPDSVIPQTPLTDSPPQASDAPQVDVNGLDQPPFASSNWGPFPGARSGPLAYETGYQPPSLLQGDGMDTGYDSGPALATTPQGALSVAAKAKKGEDSDALWKGLVSAGLGILARNAQRCMSNK